MKRFNQLLYMEFSMSNKNTISISELSKDLLAQAEEEKKQDAQTTSTEEPEPAKEEKPTSDNLPHKEEVVAPKVQPVKPKARIIRSKDESALDSVKNFLDIFLNAPIGSKKKANALHAILKLVLKMPKKIILDTIYDFFVKYKRAEFLNPINALQGTQDLAPTENVKLRVFYELMMKLAAGNANKNNLSLEMIRTIFGSDDLTTWASVKLDRNYRK